MLGDHGYYPYYYDYEPFLCHRKNALVKRAINDIRFILVREKTEVTSKLSCDPPPSKSSTYPRILLLQYWCSLVAVCHYIGGNTLISSFALVGFCCPYNAIGDSYECPLDWVGIAVSTTKPGQY